MKTTGGQQLVKRINRSALLRLMRKHPGLSRAQLALHSGLTKSTVGQLVRELIEEGWLTQVVLSPQAPSMATGQGRPSTPLFIDNINRGLLGVEIGVDCLRLAWTSLQGDVRWSVDTKLLSKAPALVCQQVASLVAQALVQMQFSGVQLTGIGVGLPGVCDESTGLVRFAPNLGWRNVELLPLLLDALAAEGVVDISVYIQNEADTAALSEYEFIRNTPTPAVEPEQSNASSLIFVNCDVGVGAGIVLNDSLFTGAQGMAGEIGHSILQIGGLPCSCGRRGCAETLIGSNALPADGSSTLDTSGHYLGVLLQNLWTTFNPHKLVVGGPTCIGQSIRVQAAQDTLDAYAHSAGMVAPVVQVARYGLLAAAVGAAALVLHHLLRPVQHSEERQRTRLSAQSPLAAQQTPGQQQPDVCNESA